LYQFSLEEEEAYKNRLNRSTLYPALEISGQGPSNRPTLTISNLYGIVTALAADFGQGIGAKVTRRLVYAQFLDA
ncbi:phage minor tail protein L, partial [Glaesserella parasuis]|nr:phage minor tail protein L [Glaesserella parasuis]